MNKKDMVNIQNGILFGHKKGNTLPLASVWTDLKHIILNEISQTEKDKYYMILLWNLKTSIA